MISKFKLLTIFAVLAIIFIGIESTTFRCREKSNFNVVLILIDALRPDRLGCCGYYRDTSPNIDEFTKKGIIFTDIIAQSALTNLSLKSMFLSQYVHSHKNGQVKDNSIASILRKNGFIAAAFTGGGRTSRAFGFGEDFDIYKDSHSHCSLADINPMVTNWLRDNCNKKFFLFVHTYDVHCPYAPPEPYCSMFVDEDFEPWLEIEGKCGNPYFNSLDLNAKDFRYLNALYDGGIRYADSMLQEILDQIEILDLADNTMIIIASDHGESLGERDYVGHGGIHDIQLKMTLIMKIPGFTAEVVTEPVQSIDIAPTVLSFLGIRIPSTMEGVNLIPVIKKDKSFNKSRLRLSQSLSSLAIRMDNKWKLIFNYRNNTYRLYNLESDFEEINDLSKEHQDIVDSLKNQLQELGDIQYNLRIDKIDINVDSSEEVKEYLRSLGYL